MAAVSLPASSTLAAVGPHLLSLEAIGDTALSELQRKADAGDADAQAELGVRFRLGTGVDQDHSEALKWLRLSAAQKNPQGQFNLALMLETGLGTAVDESEAVKLYRQAADKGHMCAQNNLACMLEEGRGTSKDIGKAFLLYLLAAKQGDPDAQCNLGTLYNNGISIQSTRKATYWLKKAAAQGNKLARSNLDFLAKRSKIAEKKEHKEPTISSTRISPTILSKEPAADPSMKVLKQLFLKQQAEIARLKKEVADLKTQASKYNLIGDSHSSRKERVG